MDCRNNDDEKNGASARDSINLIQMCPRAVESKFLPVLQQAHGETSNPKIALELKTLSASL